MSNGSEERRVEYQRLLSELEQIEKERTQIDLRDARALDECQHKLDALRKRIDRHLHWPGMG